MTLIRTPLTTSSIELSDDKSLHWKQVLPLDYALQYGSHTLKFDKAYINNVIKGFKENALGDRVAFQLADDQNRHDTEEDEQTLRNHDPERFRGWVEGMELREGYTGSEAGKNGLWCSFKLTEAGNKLIGDNTELGVSASLSQDPTNKYPVVMRHVLGTIHPKVKNMAGWEKALVSLSDVEDSNEEVLDFTMPKENEKDNTEKVEVDKAQFDAIIAYVSQKQKEDEEAAKLLEEAETEEETVEEEPEKVSLSEQPEFKAMQERLNLSESNAAKDRWARQRADLSRAGVPKAILDLSETVMGSHVAMTVNLSDGTKVDPRDTLNKILDECKGMVDLSEEEGYGRDPNEPEAERKAAEEKFNDIGQDFMKGMFDN